MAQHKIISAFYIPYFTNGSGYAIGSKALHCILHARGSEVATCRKAKLKLPDEHKIILR